VRVRVCSELSMVVAMANALLKETLINSRVNNSGSDAVTVQLTVMDPPVVGFGGMERVKAVAKGATARAARRRARRSSRWDRLMRKGTLI